MIASEQQKELLKELFEEVKDAHKNGKDLPKDPNRFKVLTKAVGER